MLEYYCVLWHSSITEEEKNDLERVQKCAVRIIEGDSYTTYEEGLERLQLEKLSPRREELSLNFAQKCLKQKQTRGWFPRNLTDQHNIRDKEEFFVQHALNERLKNSTIP